MPATPPPDAAALAEALVGPGAMWSSITVLPATGSTNADLVAAAREGASHGTVLMTDDQTAGRGRLDRAWTTPPGMSVACSVVLRPEGVPPQRWPWLSLLTGVGLVDGIRAATGVPVGLKWPNDVVVPAVPDAAVDTEIGASRPDRKLCGLLSERVDTPDGPAAVLGFGINVSMDISELPVAWATSLRLEGAEVDKTALMAAVLRALGEAYALWRDDPDALARRYAARCVTLGREVRIHLDGRADLTGTAVGIDAGGGLRVRTPAGERIIAAGDIVHVRPARERTRP